MFRELVRKNKELSKEECIEILKSEKRGVFSVNVCWGVKWIAHSLRGIMTEQTER